MCVRLYEITIAFFMMIFHPPFAKEQERAKRELRSLVFCSKSAHKKQKNAGIYHEQTSERAELHVRAVRVVQSVDVRHPDDDVKWYNFLLSLFISIIVT